MKLATAMIDYSYAAYLKIASCICNQKNHSLDKSLNNRQVLLIPGVYENWFFFRKLQKSLEQSGYKVINTDRIIRSTSILEDGARLAQYLSDKDVESVNIIGHSSGGLTALRILQLSDRVHKVITIAAPFHGVANGNILRTKLVRDLLPTSETFVELNKLSRIQKTKIVSLYPNFDNQVWNKKGSVLVGAKNIKLNAAGHHLILRSKELVSSVESELK